MTNDYPELERPVPKRWGWLLAGLALAAGLCWLGYWVIRYELRRRVGN